MENKGKRGKQDYWQKDPTTLTADDARKYCDYLLDTVSAVTLKNRVRSLKGILNVAKAEDWIDTNRWMPWICE